MGFPTALSIDVRLAPLLALLTFQVASAAAETPAPSLEDQVKAAFIYNFAKFVEWPSAAVTSAPILIGVLGKDALVGALEQTVQGKTANGRPLAVRRMARVDDLRACQILFIGAPERGRLRNLFDSLEHAAVLTVGDTDHFAASGGVINFVQDEHRIHFEINVDAAARAGLKISSRLLQVGRVVRDESRPAKNPHAILR